MTSDRNAATAPPEDATSGHPLEVTPEEAGQKLLQFLVRRLGGAVPGAALLRAIRRGEVRVDGGRRQPFFRLSAGQSIRVPPFRVASAGGGSVDRRTPDPGATDLDIIYEDAEFVAVCKPAGLCSHAGTRHSDSVADRLKARFAGTAFAPVLVHRLDKDTSGILLAAKTYAALRRTNEAVAAGGLGKCYLAWVDGVWPGAEVPGRPDADRLGAGRSDQGRPGEGRPAGGRRGWTWPEAAPQVLEDTLERLDLAAGAKGRRKIRTVAPGEGKPARCAVTVLLRKRSATLLLVRLFTGRTHQIRVQLATRGHAVISDGVYGRKVRGLPMLLHAVSLRLPGRALFAPPPWEGPFALPKRLTAALREHLAG